MHVPSENVKKARRPGRRVTPEQARQAAANLNEIDISLIALLYDLRYLRTDQVARLVYRDRPQMYVWQRLNTLHHRGLVANVKVREERSTIAIWHLDRLGLQLAEDLGSVPDGDRIPLREYTVSATYARHYTEAAEIYVGLHQTVRSGWWTWHNHRNRYQYSDDSVTGWGGETRPLYLWPDATVMVWHGSQEQGEWIKQIENTIYLELDRSTMSLTVMRQKFDKYQALFAKLAGGRWRAQDLSHYLLVVCPSEQRANNLQELLEERHLPARAVPFDQALDMLRGGLAHWWQNQLESWEEAHRERERKTQVHWANVDAWVRYERDIARWTADRDKTAQQQWNAQIIKRKKIELFLAEYEEQNPRPGQPSGQRPSPAELSAAQARLRIHD